MYIYLHIPFCSSICTYCDFPKVLYEKKYIQAYLKCLEQEVKERYHDEPVTSIYIGGGTPTCLEIDELKYLLDITKTFKKNNQIEFTIESNIESLTLEKIKLIHSYGVNRISLGVQSFQEKILKELNRHHTNKMVENVEDVDSLEERSKELINSSTEYSDSSNEIRKITLWKNFKMWLPLMIIFLIIFIIILCIIF